MEQAGGQAGRVVCWREGRQANRQKGRDRQTGRQGPSVWSQGAGQQAAVGSKLWQRIEHTGYSLKSGAEHAPSSCTSLPWPQRGSRRTEFQTPCTQ